MGDLGGEGLVVHQEEVDIADVVDEESLVSGWHHVAGLLVGTESDLERTGQRLLFWVCVFREWLLQLILWCRGERTDGMTICPLKRRRTLLSIPFGFLQDGSTRMNESL